MYVVVISFMVNGYRLTHHKIDMNALNYWFPIINDCLILANPLCHIYYLMILDSRKGLLQVNLSLNIECDLMIHLKAHYLSE